MPLRLNDLDTDSLSALFEHTDVHLVLKLVCRALRAAAPKFTDTYFSDIARSSLSHLKWAHALGFYNVNPELTSRVLVQLATCGNLDGFNWALGQMTTDGPPLYPLRIAATAAAARHGHTNILSSLHTSNHRHRHDLIFHPMVAMHAAKGGHVHVLEWMRETDNGSSFDYLMSDIQTEMCATAAGLGHLGILMWANRNYFHYSTPQCIYRAAETGQCNILMFLLAKRECTWHAGAEFIAFQNGHLDALKLLHRSHPIRPQRAQMMLRAAELGRWNWRHWSEEELPKGPDGELLAQKIVPWLRPVYESATEA